MRILVADDHETVRKGIRAVLAPRVDIEICGEARNGQEAIDRAVQTNPDLIILDLSMPVIDGYAAGREIRKLLPNVRILLFSTNLPYAKTAKEVGANGFVLKTESSDVLLMAVDALMCGRDFFFRERATDTERAPARKPNDSPSHRNL